MTGLIVCLCCQHFDLQEKSVGLCDGKCQATATWHFMARNFNINILLDTECVIYVKLHMVVILTKFYLFMPCSVTLISRLQGFKMVKTEGFRSKFLTDQDQALQHTF